MFLPAPKLGIQKTQKPVGGAFKVGSSNYDDENGIIENLKADLTCYPHSFLASVKADGDLIAPPMRRVPCLLQLNSSADHYYLPSSSSSEEENNSIPEHYYGHGFRDIFGESDGETGAMIVGLKMRTNANKGNNANDNSLKVDDIINKAAATKTRKIKPRREADECSCYWLCCGASSSAVDVTAKDSERVVSSIPDSTTTTNDSSAAARLLNYQCQEEAEAEEDEEEEEANHPMMVMMAPRYPNSMNVEKLSVILSSGNNSDAENDKEDDKTATQLTRTSILQELAGPADAGNGEPEEKIPPEMEQDRYYLPSSLKLTRIDSKSQQFRICNFNSETNLDDNLVTSAPYYYYLPSSPRLTLKIAGTEEDTSCSYYSPSSLHCLLTRDAIKKILLPYGADDNNYDYVPSCLLPILPNTPSYNIISTAYQSVKSDAGVISEKQEADGDNNNNKQEGSLRLILVDDNNRNGKTNNADRNKDALLSLNNENWLDAIIPAATDYLARVAADLGSVCRTQRILAKIDSSTAIALLSTTQAPVNDNNNFEEQTPPSASIISNTASLPAAKGARLSVSCGTEGTLAVDSFLKLKHWKASATNNNSNNDNNEQQANAATKTTRRNWRPKVSGRIAIGFDSPAQAPTMSIASVECSINNNNNSKAIERSKASFNGNP